MAERELSILLSLKDQASKELGNFSTKIKSLEPRFQKMAVAGTATFGLLSGAILGAVSSAANMESVEISFKTMLKSAEAAKDMVNQLNLFAAKTPYEFQEIANASKSLLAFGIPAKMMQDELKKVGDIASGIGGNLGDIAELYGKAKVQGRLYGEDINQLTGRGIPIIQELAKQFGVSEQKVKEFVTAGKVNFGHLSVAFDNMTKEGGQFFNMMEAQSASTAGTWSTFNDNINTTIRAIGMQFLPVLKELMNTLTPILETVAAWTATHPELVKNIVLAALAISGLLAVVGTLGLVLPAIIAGFTFFTGTVGLVGVAILGIIAIFGIWAAAIKIWKNDSEMVILGVKTYWQEFKTFFIGIWDSIKLYFADVWSGIKIIFNEAIDSMIAKIQPLIDMINRVVEGTKSIGGGIINGVKSKLGFGSTSVNDAIISPNGNIISTHPDDYLIATKDPHSLANGNGGGINITIYGDVSGTELIEKIKKALTKDINRQVRI